MVNNKPNLFQNKQIPISELSADSFEDFVYQSLVLLEHEKKFQMQSGRQPSGDEGFDCTAKTIINNDLVCIQCKRYSDTLYTATVVEEIVKVALNGILDNSIPKYHYIISSGTVSQKLRKQLRQNNYNDLKKECKKFLDDKKKQLTLIKKIKEESIDPYITICDYLDSLQSLIIWSGIDFQNELVVIWSKLNDILEKHFSLAVVFKEHPRPDFNVSNYIEKKQRKNQNLVPLFFQETSLPTNLKVEGNRESFGKELWSINDIISHLKNNKNILISSLGGSGKSSTLSLIEEHLVNTFEDLEYVPIRINLRSYSRNTLKQRINQELDINYGSWKSLPFKFIFLFDALDEMLQHDTQAFIDELNSIIDGYSFILTIRSSGLNIQTTIPMLDYCISVQPLSYRNAFEMAEQTFKDEELKLFYNEYRKRLSSIGFNFLSLPFVLSMTIDYYKKHKTIPEKMEDILESWIQSKIKSDSAKIRDNINKVNQIPTKYIKQTFSLILYKSRIEKKLFSIPKDNYHEIILECYDELNSSNSYITRVLDVNEFVSMLSHYEILVLENDNHYLTPHSIISDYLVAKEFANNWKSHVENSLVNSLSDVWLYSSNFIKDNEREEFLSLVMSFNFILGAKISKKFGNTFIKKVEKIILENEQSEQVLKRSEAIYALGILGTDTCLERLRSKMNYLDMHHSGQCIRSLAVHGDRETLYQILKENEQKAQAPIKISGGTYSIWFNSSPMVITDIARSRLNEWIKDKSIPLSFCLETIALFGDSCDTDILVLIIENTKIHKEFDMACIALNVINRDLLITLLKRLISKKHFSSHNAKKVLLECGIKSDIDDEFNYFIEQCNKAESELVEQSYVHFLMELSEFIGKFELNESQIDKLIETYKSLKFPHDFYIYRLFWSIAIENKFNSFLPIVELTFSRKYSEEIHQAMYYLLSLEPLNISNELTKQVEDYFTCIEEKSYGLKINYAKYYLKQGKKEIAHKIIFEDVEKLLINISPKTITYDQYNFSFTATNVIFDYFDIDKNIKIDNSIALKLLLINTNYTPKEDKIKKVLLNKIDINKIENYTNEIENIDVKIYVSDYLLKNDFTHHPVEILKKYLPIFLSHNIYYDTIKKVCKDNWNDELAGIFLSNFLNYSWDAISAQMFEKYTDFYALILSKDQLKEFEKKRDKQISPLVSRIYKIWLECNGLS